MTILSQGGRKESRCCPPARVEEQGQVRWAHKAMTWRAFD